MARIYRGAQERLFNLWQRDTPTTIAAGPMRSGKTSSALDGWLMYMLMRGGRGVIASPRLELVEGTLVPQIKEMVPGARYVRGRIELFGGADREVNPGITIYCRSGRAAEDSISSLSLSGVYLDEATKFPSRWFEMARTRVVLGGGKLVATCNPEHPGHWLKRNWIDRADGKRIEAHAFTIDDNPVMTADEKEELRLSLHGASRQRNYHGLWVAEEGAVYPMVADCAGKPGKRSKPVGVWLAGDYGNTDPTHFIRIEEHEDGNRYITREYRWSTDDGGFLSDEEKARALLTKLAAGGEPIHTIHVDPSANGMIAALRRVTRAPVRGADNRVLPGIDQVRAMLELGRLYIDDEACPHTWLEMQAYSWQSLASARGVSIPEHEFSHAPDAVRYHCASTLLEEYWEQSW